MRQNDRSLEMTKQQHQTQYVCRTCFTRQGATSYIGHLDLMKTIERAIRRAELPILYSQGYNPRPMMVFALPLGVGIHTTGDYFDASMSVPVDAMEFLAKVNPQLPDGLRLNSCVSIDEPKRSLMSVVTVAEYTIEAPDITRYILQLFKRDEVLIEKKSKGKIVTTDIRPLMIKPLTDSTPDIAHIMVYAGSSKNLRPDVLLNSICKHEGYSPDLAADATVTRVKLYGGDYPDIESIEGLV